MVPPKRTADHSQVHMVRPRISPPEELSSGDILFTSMRVTRRFERVYIALDFSAFAISGQNVDNGLGRQAGHGRTSGMLEQYGQSRERENRPHS